MLAASVVEMINSGYDSTAIWEACCEDIAVEAVEHLLSTSLILRASYRTKKKIASDLKSPKARGKANDRSFKLNPLPFPDYSSRC